MKLYVKNFFVKLELEQSYDEDQLYLKKVTIDDDTVGSDFEDGIYNTEWLKKVLQHPNDPTEKLNEKYDKLMRNLPFDNGKYYIQHIPGSLTVALKQKRDLRFFM